MSASYFRPELHGQTDSEREQRLAIMRSSRMKVSLGIKSDWEPVQVWAKHVWIVDEVYRACTRPEEGAS